MCGRFALFSNINTITKFADLIAEDVDWTPRYNLSPGSKIVSIIAEQTVKKLTFLEWGYSSSQVSHQGKQSSSYLIINTRADTIVERGSFDVELRCLIPANGFYEWEKENKQPYYFTLDDEELFFLAGTYNFYGLGSKDKKGGKCSIITTAANEIVEPIHHRMPVIIEPSRVESWLKTDDWDEVLRNFEPYPAEKMSSRPVSRRVNSTKNDDPSLIDYYTPTEEILYLDF